MKSKISRNQVKCMAFAAMLVPILISLAMFFVLLVTKLFGGLHIPWNKVFLSISFGFFTGMLLAFLVIASCLLVNSAYKTTRFLRDIKEWQAAKEG